MRGRVPARDPSPPGMPLKNILLINPWIYDFTAYDFWLRPLGLLGIASVLRDHARVRLHYIDCLDRRHPLLEKTTKDAPDGRGAYPREEVPKPAVLKDVPRTYARYGIPIGIFLGELDRVPVPDLVLLTCVMTYWYPGVQLAVELVRKKFGNVPVVLGGVYATLMPEHARRESGADRVVEGPAENQVLPLARDILGDETVGEAGFRSMDEWPLPAWDLCRDRRSLALLTSRGCPFRCSFCAGPLINRVFEQRSPESVISEINSEVRLFGTRHFAFYDDALLLKKNDHVIPILKGVIRRKLPAVFHTPNGLHVREIDAETARLFRRAGFRSIYLSQESVDEDFLGRACPKVSPGDLESAASALERAGYSRRDLNVYLIVGVPGQSASGIRESILHVRRLGLTPRVAFFSPVPGTPDWSRLVERGTLPRDADPLLSNKLTFPYLWGNFAAGDFEEIRALLHQPPSPH